jgi:hypothetical protein
MKQINIRRYGSLVHFEQESIDVTENVYFTNLDSTQPHWPSLSDNQLAPAPSDNSSQCTVPVPQGNPPPPYSVPYTCKLHRNEEGIILVFAKLAAGTTTLPQVSVNKGFAAPVQVVVGGKSPYTVTGQEFQVIDDSGKVIQSGKGNLGPGVLIQNVTTDNQGIYVAGIPSLVGTYQFTFTVNDAMGKNLQQVQYSMKVV